MQNMNQERGLTAKELEYLTDSMKNEDLLTKLCAQGAAESQSAELRQTLSQMAQDRLQSFSYLLGTLQQQSTLAH